MSSEEAKVEQLEGIFPSPFPYRGRLTIISPGGSHKFTVEDALITEERVQIADCDGENCDCEIRLRRGLNCRQDYQS